MRIGYKEKLDGFLADNKRDIGVENIIRATKNIMITAYKRETPVNKGAGRRYVMGHDIRGGYYVDTNVKRRGFKYMEAVGLGTGRFKNSPNDWPSTGRIRSGESAIFKGTGGIRPNKFHERAQRKAKPQIFKFVIKELNKL